MPPSALDVDLDALLTDIRAGSGQIHDAVDGILSAAGHVLDLLSDVVPTDGLVSQVRQLRRAHDEAEATLDRLLLVPGMPRALRATGTVWSAGVGGPVSGLAAFATLNGVRVDDHWTGPAADAYRNTLLPQSTALTAIRSACDEIDVGLGEFATAVIAFWTSVHRALVELLVALGTAAVTAVTGTGTLLGIAFGVAALVAFTASVTGTMSAFTELSAATARRAAELERLLTNDTAFPGGTWPVSATPISGDGSITDGDDTDWHLR